MGKGKRRGQRVILASDVRVVLCNSETDDELLIGFDLYRPGGVFAHGHFQILGAELFLQDLTEAIAAAKKQRAKRGH